MVAKTPGPWRELCRIGDPVLARAVATSIAAMEFDVRLHAPASGAAHVIEVSSRHYDDLDDVLEEIISEQAEFDRRLAERREAHQPRLIVVVIALTGAADLFLMLVDL